MWGVGAMKFMRTMSGALRACLGALAWAGSVQAATGASAGGLNLTWMGGSPAMGEGMTAAVNGLDWACGTDGCSLSAAPSIDFVFGAGTAGTRSVTDEKLMFEFEITRIADVTVLDPQGRAHSLVPLLGQWSFGLDVLGNPAPPDAQINTAHGRIDLEVGLTGNGQAFSWRPDRFPESALGLSDILDDTLAVKQSQRLASGWTGRRQVGPAEDGRADLVPVGQSWDWQLGARVFSPYYALPSTTDPRCAALSCMEMVPGVMLTGGYRLSVGAQLATAVPEPSVLGLSALGLSAGALLMRRRQQGRKQG